MENRTKLKKSEDTLEEFLRFERLLSNLSAQFVNLAPDQVDGAIQQALQTILEFFQVDRCGLLQIFSDKRVWKITHAAYADNVSPVPVGVELPTSGHPWAYDLLVVQKRIISFSNLDELPPEANVDKEAYAKFGVLSVLDIPIIVGSSVTHIIAINTVNRTFVWPQDLIPRLRLLGDVFVGALRRKEMEQDLHASEERLLLASSAAEVGLWTMSLETGHVWATPLGRELFGLSLIEELNLANILELVHPDDRTTVHATIKKALEAGKFERVEYRIQRPGGKCRWIVSRGQAISCLSGQHGSLMGVSIDITERKNLEIRVKEQFA